MAQLYDVLQHGQQIWLDNLSRSLVADGSLQKRIEEGVTGITSNPAIFKQSFEKDPRYSEEITRLKQQNLSPKARYETLAVADVQAACDAFRPLFDKSKGSAGRVSLEVAPDLANDTSGTLNEARDLWARLDRPNAMIKVPATDAGLAALTELIGEGISVNLTLLFSRAQALKAYAAYTEGIRRAKEAGVPTLPQAVASFFISRVDTALDPTLPEHLRGQVAVALAKAAYADWQDYFHGAAFAAEGAEGIAPMRLLWASTGTKNPAYSDTLYVDSLIGADTVNTVPEATLQAFLDHGRWDGAKSTAPLVDDVEKAQNILAEVAALGINLETLATRLQEDGLTLFEEAFAALLKPLA